MSSFQENDEDRKEKEYLREEINSTQGHKRKWKPTLKAYIRGTKANDAGGGERLRKTRLA